MKTFFILVMALGAAQCGLVYLTRTAKSDSWPQELAVYNPFWGFGIIAIGLVGLGCVTFG